MLRWSLALARRALPSSHGARFLSTAPLVLQHQQQPPSGATTSTTISTSGPKAQQQASHILALSAPLKDEEPSLIHQQKQFLQSLGNDPQPADIDLAFKVYEKVLELSKGVDKFACARLSLLCLNGGMPDRALDPWARLLEALAVRINSPRTLERILDLPEFEPAAMAALAAYFVVAGPAADPETARKLVPRRQIPSNLSILRNLGGIKSADAERVALRGLAGLRRHTTHNFTDPSFLAQVDAAPYAELNKLWEQVMLATASKPEEIPEECYAAFIRRFAETRQSQRAFDLWQQLVRSGVKISTRAWVALLRAALCAPKNSEMLFTNFWDKMIANGFKPDAAATTERLLCLSRHRSVDELMAELSRLRKEEPQLLEMPGINIVLSALARAQRFDEADELLQWASTSENPKLEPTTYTYNALISAASRKPEVGARYLQQMISRGIKPSIVTYTFAMQQLLKRGEPIGDLLEEMRAANIEPNERFNTTLAYYLGRNTRDLSAARKTMQTILDRRLRISIETVGAFVELELRHGDVDRAVQYTRLMHKFGLTPNLPTYNQLIRGALRRGRIDVARSTFDSMVSGSVNRLRPNTYTYMFLLQPWSTADLETRREVRDLVAHVANQLVQQPGVIEFALSERIKRIADATGTDLIPEKLVSIAAERQVEDFDKRKSPKARK